ncbi:hypothetical protein RN001_007671 [Aquatica leii]|uniref:Lebercilin domain-containing protein n=1 Tax=Aquatica leii TaxID=1421715 RepID=A0AAN7SR13_9COLE|nr:hypothetical protein RN001_007671 [Aquatica leii]
MANSASTASVGKQSLHRRKSCDTVCSSSSCLMQKRKPVHPLAASVCTFIPRNNAVQQRVLSARLLKVRSLQSKLNDANFHLAVSIYVYEGTNADLPRLLQTYEEDIRILTTKNKTLRKNLKDTVDQLKTKDEEITSVREQLKNLVALTKNKNLGERHVLSEQVDDLKEKLKNSDEKINLLNRKLLLETKNYKSKLNGEILKNKQRQKELSHALAEIDRLNVALEGKGKTLITPVEHKRFSTNNRQSISLTNLINDKLKPKLNVSIKMNSEKQKDNDDENELEFPSVKLEPIMQQSVSFSNEVVMMSPSDNIKARLSSNLTREIDQLNKTVSELGLDENLPDDVINTAVYQKYQTNSSLKLDKITSPDIVSKKLDEVKMEHDINKRLGNCCSEMRTTIKDCSVLVDKHKENFDSANDETERLLRSLQQTDHLNAKLRYANFLSADKIEIPEHDLEIAKEIWNNEYSFRKESKVKNGKKNFLKSDRNGNVLNNEEFIKQEEKHKLLATMRAIDNEGYDISLPSTSNLEKTSFDDYFNGFD